MGTLLKDIRYGIRNLLKRPGFTLVVVITLALGIGANTAIFSVVNAVLIRSLPYRDPGRLVLIENAFLTYDPSLSLEDRFSPNYRLKWKEEVNSCEQIAAYGAFEGGVNLTGSGEPERVEATEVTANFFSTLGVNPVTGRSFLPEDEQPGKNHVAIISSELWRRSFGEKIEAVGQTIRLNGKNFTIIGVAPSGLRFPSKLDVWIPIAPSLEDRVFTGPMINYQVFARLKPNVTLDQTKAEMAVFSERLKQAGSNSRSPIQVMPLLDHLVAGIRPALRILFGAVGLVLLIACANVASLLLATATSRRKEMAIRAALGGARWQLIRQLMVESLLLALLGGVAGLLLATWLINLLTSISPSEIPRIDEVSLDWRIFAFTSGVSLFTGILIGLLPAFLSSKVDLTEALKDGLSKALPGWGGRSIRGMLVVMETALALVLLVGAGLLMRSFVNVLSIDSGFETQNILTASLTLPETKYENANQRWNFFQQLMERLKAMPETTAVAITNKVPLSKEDVVGFLFEAENQPPDIKFGERFGLYLTVSPDYFQAMGIRLVEGRYFNERDTVNSPPVIIINEGVARRFFGNGGAIGKRITVVTDKKPREIVGVVREVRTLGLEEKVWKELYLPWPQAPGSRSTLIVRTTSGSPAMAAAVRAVAQSLDSDLPLYDIKTMDQRVSESVAKRRFILLLMTFFAALALLLTMTGIYGVISYNVAQQTREIGIRMALGARNAHVLKLVLRSGMSWTLAGVAIGLGSAFAAVRLLTSLLFGVPPTDVGTFVLVSLVLTVVALLACYIPARRATKVDPLVALRYE